MQSDVPLLGTWGLQACTMHPVMILHPFHLPSLLLLSLCYHSFESFSTLADIMCRTVLCSVCHVSPRLCAKRIRRNCAVLIKCCMQETQPFEMVIITCIANPIRLVYHLEILRNLKRVGTHGLLNPPAGDAGYIPVIMIR